MSNLAPRSHRAHNQSMDFAQLFVGFLQPVALGSAAVFILFYLVRLKTPRRSPAFLSRKPSR